MPQHPVMNQPRSRVNDANQQLFHLPELTPLQYWLGFQRFHICIHEPWTPCASPSFILLTSTFGTSGFIRHSSFVIRHSSFVISPTSPIPYSPALVTRL